MSSYTIAGPVTLTVSAPGGPRVEFKLNGVNIKPIHKSTPMVTDVFSAQMVTDYVYQGSSLEVRGDLYSGVIPGEKDPARQLAHAVLDGDTQAIFPLIDYLLENREKPLTTDQRVGVVSLYQEQLDSLQALAPASAAIRRIIQQLEKNK